MQQIRNGWEFQRVQYQRDWHVLEKKGLVKNGQFFNYYTFKNYSNFKSVHFIAKSMDLNHHPKRLTRREPKTPQAPVLGKVTIRRLYDRWVRRLSTDVPLEGRQTPLRRNFLKAVQDDAFIEKMVAKYPKLLANLPSKDSVFAIV